MGSVIERAYEQGEGILRLAPTWVPRSLCSPGRRIKLHPDEYYSYGPGRGAITERWLASTTRANNGPETTEHEGLSFAVFDDGHRVEKVLLRDAVAELGAGLTGSRIRDARGGWQMYAKFFDNQEALPHHIHPDDSIAKLTGRLGKPEAYYFPVQMNNHFGDFPYTFFGLEPGTTRGQVLRALEAFAHGDNRITNLSKAYRLEPGTGWDVPPGLLHAPGSLCTYEPQKAADIGAIYQSAAGGQVLGEEVMWKSTPEDRRGDYKHLLDMIDWDLNLDADLKASRFMEPIPAGPVDEMEAKGYSEKWICYKSDAFSAKELTVMPGQTVTVRDGGAYGVILVQGHGRMGVWDVETPTLIRFGQLTCDEFFVGEPAAKEGVTITNSSRTEPLVMLKHFGPGNPDLNSLSKR